MSYSAKIICDSISKTGKRLTTFEITFPRIVLAEAKTHRVIRGMGGNIEELDLHNLGVNDDENLSRNSASTRAIPLKKQIERIRKDPFIPERFPLNCSGMQPKEYISQGEDGYEWHKERWLAKMETFIYQAEKDAEIYNWHKQLVGRPLEVFMWHTAIVTATEWDNFFKLRTNEQAQYEIRRIADLMYECYHNSGQSIYNGSIKQLKQGEWHLPFVDYNSDSDDWKQIDTYVRSDIVNKEARLKNYGLRFIETAKKISVARCARVSYLTHDGVRDIEKDLELFEKLRTSGHYSPFEHIATPSFVKAFSGENRYTLCQHDEQVGSYFNIRNGNFIGWRQFRQDLPNENCKYFRKENQN